MDLLSKKVIKELFLKYDAQPSKMMGQNFLISQKAIDEVIEASMLTPKDTVLEVGPGIGTLTQELAKRVKKVIAIEKDRLMIKILQETLKEYFNVEVIHDDILKISNLKFQISNYKVVANIPYYLTSALIRKFLEAKNKPEMMVLMIQKEVAQRICSKPPKMSLLAVSVQFYAKPQIIFNISRKSFWPSPNVDSAIIKITPPRELGAPSPQFSDDFFRIVKAGFSQPRKQLLNNLSKALKMDKSQINLWLLNNNIKPEQRAETLSVSDWENLTFRGVSDTPLNTPP